MQPANRRDMPPEKISRTGRRVARVILFPAYASSGFKTCPCTSVNRR